MRDCGDGWKELPDCNEALKSSRTDVFRRVECHEEGRHDV